MKKTLLLLVALATSANAVIIDNPLTLQTQFLAGILNGQPSGGTDAVTEQGYAQTILDLPLGGSSGVAPNQFFANTLFNYAGTITFNGGQSQVGIENGGDDFVSIPAGWGGALAKYDGPQGGYILFLFGGTASTIPEFPYDFWTDSEQRQLSHYTLFRGTGAVTPTPTDVEPVPEGGVGVGFFGLLLAGMGWARRKFAA